MTAHLYLVSISNTTEPSCITHIAISDWAKNIWTGATCRARNYTDRGNPSLWCINSEPPTCNTVCPIPCIDTSANCRLNLPLACHAQREQYNTINQRKYTHLQIHRNPSSHPGHASPLLATRATHCYGLTSNYCFVSIIGCLTLAFLGLFNPFSPPSDSFSISVL
jgi:hypothetical protein